MAKKKRKRNASRGSVNNIILKTLVNGDKYGYEIIKEVDGLSNGKFKLKQPSLYSSLSRFEDKEFVSSYWGDSDIGGRRHYYHLTELGLNYYKKNVLKEVDEDDIIDEEDETEDNIQNNNSKSDTKTADLDKDKDEEESIHLENLKTAIEKLESNSSAITDEDNSNKKENNEKQIEPSPWKTLSDSTKKSNKLVAETNYNKLYIKKPKKVQKIIKDTDGIFKLRDEDYVSKKNSSTNVVIDNVRKRTKARDVLYDTYNETKKSKDENNSNFREISEEEKLKRNENFLAKFNLLTMSKMKPVSTPTPKPVVEEKKPEKPIDYRGKLDAIYNTLTQIQSNDEPEEVNENNLFNYKDEDSWTSEFNIKQQENITEEDDDKFVELDAVEEFDIKENTDYEDKINTISNPKSKVNMSRYDYSTQAILQDKSYLLNNKLKMVFGIIMTLIMLIEVSTAWYIFDMKGLVFTYTPVFIASYVIIGLFALFTLVPYFINSNSHKANNYRFKYSFWFGILTFLVCGILIYCVNALYGFEIDNFIYFAVKIVVPLLLASNFVIAPIIYGLLTKSRKFYD